MANYLVTGCAGFIGAAVTELLLKDDHQVTGVDNLNESYDPCLKRWRLSQFEAKPGFTFRPLDVSDRGELGQLLDSKFDAVINLAARAGVRQSVEDPWVYFETNLIGTLNLLEFCRELRVSKFVLASTSSLYDADAPQPFREEFNTDTPITPYAASKKAAEALCYTYHHLYGIDVSVLRFFTVYGPAGRPDMSLFRFVQWIAEGQPVVVYGDGKQSRDFTYVQDIAKGTLLALKPLGYQVINLGSNVPVMLLDVIHLVENLLGKKANIDYRARHSTDRLSTWADIGKAEQILSWRPQVNIEQGLEHLVTWYGENRSWAKNVVTL